MKKEVPAALLGTWKSLDLNALKIPADHKFIDRERWITIHWQRLHRWIPDYLYGPKLRFADISSGNGATMEILRYLGHDVTGMDYSFGFPEGEWMYKPMIDSQQLNCVCHEGTDLPYPFADKEFDVLINYGSMTFYKPAETWPSILDEFTRITKKCIFVAVNVGEIYDNSKHLVENWKHPDFKLTDRENSHFVWNSTGIP